MKKIAIFLLLMLSFILVVSCDENEPGDSGQSGAEEELNIDIEKLVGELKYQYDMGEYITLPEYNGQRIEIKQDDVQRRIDNYILEYAKKTNKTICMIGDVVDISYIGYELDENGKILNDGGKTVVFDERESFGIYLGSSLAHKELEDGIIGMAIGEQRDIYVTMPSDYAQSDLAGKRVLFDVFLIGVYEPSLYNDAFVSENFDGYKTVEELEKAIIMEMVYSYLSENAEVIKYPEKEYAELENQLKDSEKDFEKENGISLDKYIENVYGKTRDEYIKDQIKNTMVIYTLAQLEGFAPTNDELVNEKKELVAYYKSYYVSKGANEKEALKNANEVVNALGISYLYENVVSRLLDQRMLELVEIDKKPGTYKSVTVSLSERAKAEIGKEIGNTLPSFELEVFDERGALSTTLNPGGNVGMTTVIFFWDNKNESQTAILSMLDRLAKENDVTVYAIHSVENYGSAADYLMENFADSKIIFLRDYAENGSDVITTQLGDQGANTYALFVNGDGVIKANATNMQSYEELVLAVEGINE